MIMWGEDKLDGQCGSPVEQIAKGSGEFSLTGDLQAEAQKASTRDVLGGFLATGRELDYVTL